MSPVEDLSVHSVQLSHASEKIYFRSLHHETIGMADPPVSFYHTGEGIEKITPILITHKNGLPGVTS